MGNELGVLVSVGSTKGKLVHDVSEIVWISNRVDPKDTQTNTSSLFGFRLTGPRGILPHRKQSLT